MMSPYHLPNPGGAVENVNEVVVSHIFQLVPVKVSLCKVRQPSDLAVGSVGNVTKEMLDYKHKISLGLGGEL